MGLAAESYLVLDGQEYMIARSGAASSLRRSHQAIEASQVQGKRVQPPFVDAEVLGFEAGEGLRTVDDDATGYYSAQGMEPHTEVPTSGHLRLKIGRSFTEAWSAVASAGGYVALAVYQDKLYALRADAAIVDEWDGATRTARDFSASIGGGALGVSMVASGRWLVIGSSDGNLVTWDGSAFTAEATGQTGRVDVIGMRGQSETLFFYAVESPATPSVLVKTWNIGVTHASVISMLNHRFAAGVVHAGTVYFALVRDPSAAQPHARLYSVPESGGVNSQVLLDVPDNYPLVMRAYNGAIYCGMAWGGSIRTLEGNALREIGRFGTTVAPDTIPGTDAIYALTPFGDSLYAAGYDASAASGTRTWLRRYRVDPESGDGGWHTVSIGGDDLSTAIRSLAAYQQTLVFGDEEAANGRMYELSKTLRLTGASLTLGDFQFGTPSLLKRFVHLSVQHDPLLDGQAVTLGYSLDGAAAVTVGTNRRVGSTETSFNLGAGVRGWRLRPTVMLTNEPDQDLIVASAHVRMLPAPPMAEMWQAELQLSPDAYDPSDTRTELDRYQALHALQRDAAIFQVVHKYRDADGLPLLAMLAVLASDVPLLTTDVGAGGGSVSATAPIRLLQAVQPENLLLNASFEQDASGAAPTDWTTTGTATSDDTSDDDAADGTRSLKLAFDGTSASAGRTQTVEVVPGWWYTLSASAKRASLTAGTVTVGVFESGVIDQAVIALGAGSDAAFVRRQGVFQVPDDSSGTVAVRLLGIQTPAGAVYFDAVQLEPSIPASDFRERGAGG